VPIVAVQGADDDLVLPDQCETCVNAAGETGGDADLVLIPGRRALRAPLLP
jgi:hypothetical protein